MAANWPEGGRNFLSVGLNKMEDDILLKPNPERGLPYLLMFPVYAAALVAMALKAQPTPWLPLFLTVLGLLGMLILGVGALSMFRTFRISREWITISLFRVHRFYPWSDFTIHYESYRDPLMVPYMLGERMTLNGGRDNIKQILGK